MAAQRGEMARSMWHSDRMSVVKSILSFARAIEPWKRHPHWLSLCLGTISIIRSTQRVCKIAVVARCYTGNENLKPMPIVVGPFNIPLVLRRGCSTAKGLRSVSGAAVGR
ncbi:hypothetical protein FOYG_11605 [Fusarium oxysporum NRRL 32931]|uniref:Uncharacterized protein n=1 Tax=Fusarium oxysporum NRRL 32931 TaxID=660029 RepID=W9HYL4_FUSOX|nr:hypothetical protein FOYG_11605 [Fusarium oxysporum NRRL 32931]